MKHTGRTYLHLLLIAMLSCLNTMSIAQEIFVRPFPLYYNLPTNEVFDIHQDCEGYIWMGTTNGLVRYDGHRLFVVRSDYSHQNKLTNNEISVITDSEKQLWVGTRSGLNIYDKQTGQTWAFPDKQLSTENINSLSYSASDKTVWVATNNGKVYQCNEQGKVLKRIERLSTKNKAINEVYSDSHGQLWALNNDGIYLYDAAKGGFRFYGNIQGRTPANFFTMLEDKNGCYWIGSWGNGVFRFMPELPIDKRFEHKPVINLRTGEQDDVCYSMAQDGNKGHLWLLSYNSLYEIEIGADGSWHQIDNRRESYAHKMYTRIISDHEGNLWLSSYDMAYTLYFNHSEVNNFPVPQIKNQWGWDTNLLDLVVTNDKTVWLTQDRYGLCIYDMKGEEFLSDERKVTNVAGEVDIMRRSIMKPGVWICHSSNRQIIRMERQGLLVAKCEQIVLPNDDDAEAIKNFHEDRNGVVWIQAGNTLYRKKPESATCQIVPKIKNVSLLFTDDRNNVYVLSENGTWTGLTQPSTHKLSLPSDAVLLSACMDSKSRLWALASDGLILRQEQGKQALSSTGLEKEVEGCALLGILPAGNNVWIVANRKIILYDVEHERQLIYEAGNGEIMVDLFRHNAYCTDGRNGLYAGGHNGFIHISPRQMQTDHMTTNMLPIVTDVVVDGKSIFWEADGHNSFHDITLPANCRNVSISFSLLRYAPDQHARIAWRLVGVDKDWTWLSSDNNYQAFYNTIPKGEHKFQIKVEISPGVFSEPYDCMTIYRKPAFYETWWAYLFYVLFLAAVAYATARFTLRRMRKANERKLTEEVTQTKMDYFTNVSHELLTPLSVISCIAETLEVSKTESSKLPILHSNINRLRRLIQQVLDFRRTDAGQLPLRTSQGDIGKFVKQTCDTNFTLLAQQKGITLNVDVAKSPLIGNVDFEKLDKILYNLLSNALKYTQRGGKVDVECHFLDEKQANGRPSVQLKVRDNGLGIAEKEQEKIFTRYYSNHRPGVVSNGIGLSLTRIFVELHGGSIRVESALHKGSTFIVILPIDNLIETEDSLSKNTTVVQPELQPSFGETRPLTPPLTGKTILLMDDNTELLTLTANYLATTFNVLKATTVKEAWDVLTTNEDIRLIITDVMFPDGNGLEFCKRIKHDVRFSHLPVIILTAKATELDRVQSYQSGADGYLAKPFSLEVLLARTKNLIWLSETRKSSLSQNEQKDLRELGGSREDQELVENITTVIEAHLSETDFDLNQLSDAMNISKSTLHRKIKAMTGMTPAEFIRNVKMRKACIMITSTSKTIAEVAYSLGYSDPKYFTKCFKEEFGISPTKYKQKEQDK